MSVFQKWKNCGIGPSISSVGALAEEPVTFPSSDSLWESMLNSMAASHVEAKLSENVELCNPS